MQLQVAQQGWYPCKENYHFYARHILNPYTKQGDAIYFFGLLQNLRKRGTYFICISHFFAI